jgi:hypothetical protein
MHMYKFRNTNCSESSHYITLAIACLSRPLLLALALVGKKIQNLVNVLDDARLDL